MTLRRLLGLFLAIVMTSLCAVGTAHAARAPHAAGAPHAYPVTVCSTLSVSTTVPTPGESITVTGTAFRARVSVRLVLSKLPPAAFLKQKNPAASGYDLGTFRTDARGSFSAVVTLPDAITSRGSFYIYAVSGAVRDTSCPVDPYQELTIAAAAKSTTPHPAATTDGGGLASTGLDIALLVTAALVLIAAGIVVNRRGAQRS